MKRPSRPTPNGVFLGFLAATALLSIALTVIDHGWWPVLAVPAVLAVVALLGHADRLLRRANRWIKQIFDDELS